jgi:lysozyme family protein
MFNEVVNIVLRNEGGYVDHPNDPGGETNFGITKRNYPHLDIKNLTREQAREIYRKDYWEPMRLNGLDNEELILHVFDMGVNAGIRTAIKILQRLVLTKDDGIIGPITTELVNRSTVDLVDLYKAERRKYYCDLVRRKPDLAVFLNGWMNRVEKTKL